MSSPRLLAFAYLALMVGTLSVACGKDARELPQQVDDSSGVGGGSEPGDSEDPDPETDVAPQTVISWVPHYAIAAAKRVFSSDYGGVRPADTLTRLGLQFWTLKSDGTIGWLNGADAEATKWFVDECHQKEIRVLLTVMNDGTELGQPGFHWGVVRSALADGGAPAVAETLLAIVEEFDLDGIDLDLEAGGIVGPYTEDDRALFLELVKALGQPLHDAGHLLTVDSFISDSGVAPGPKWWSDWLGDVDTIHAMGYTYSYKNGPGMSGYQYLMDQAKAAGYPSERVLSGLPVWVNAWAGDESNFGISHEDNLKHIAHCLSGPTGVALWAFHHPEVHRIPETGERPWVTPEPWAVVQELKNGHDLDPSLCEVNEVDEALIDDMQSAGRNRLGGNWLAVTDYWDRPESDRAGRTSVLTYDDTYDLALGEGNWGMITEGYRLVEDLGRVLSTHVITGTGASSYGGLWMEFLPRDCSQLDTPSDGCGWRQEALVGLDLTGSETLTFSARCEVGQAFSAGLQSRELAIAWATPFYQEAECTGAFEDYTIDLAQAGLEIDLSEVVTLRLELWSDEPGAELNLDVLGVAKDASVIELRGID